jgi:hypothetical protein
MIRQAKERASMGNLWRFSVVGVSAAAALALTGAAPSASPSPAAQLIAGTVPAKTGGGVVLDVLPSEDAPAPAQLVYYVPAGFVVNTSVAPGTAVGELIAFYYTKSIPFDFADVTVKAGDPATLPGDPAAQACAPGPHAAFWTATFKVSKNAVTIRFYVDPTTGAETSLGAFKLVSCLASPYILPAQGGAPGGLQYDLIAFHFSHLIVTDPTSGSFLWRMLVTPYNAGTGTMNTAGAFEARTHVDIPHVLTAHARYLPKTKTVLVTGKLTALGQPRAGVRVWIASGLNDWGKVRTKADGSYSFRHRVLPGKRARTLGVDAYLIIARGACTDPPVAPAGCVDENLSPPNDGITKVRIPKK